MVILPAFFAQRVVQTVPNVTREYLLKMIDMSSDFSFLSVPKMLSVNHFQTELEILSEHSMPSVNRKSFREVFILMRQFILQYA